MSTVGPTQLLPLAIVVPITGAVLTPLSARVSRYLALSIAVAASLGSVVVLLLSAPSAYRGEVRTVYLGQWTPVNGHALGVAITSDAFGITAALIAASVGTLAMLATLSGMEELGRRELGAYACLSLLLIASVVAGALTPDLLDMFVWFEVAALASYALTGFFLSRPPAVEAAFKIVVLTSMAGFLAFIATALVYQQFGAVNLGQIEQSLNSHAGAVAAIALGLLVAGYGTKAGLIPFNGWLPDAHTAAPGPISALFSGVLVNFGVVAIARIGESFAPARFALGGVLMVVGVGSALLGAGFAVAQDDLKRLLAYDTIAEIGIVIVGLAASSATGAAGMTYHLASHALFKSMLFLIAGAIVHSTGATTLGEMSGLARRSPWLAGLFVLGAAAIAGIPPLNAYVSLGLIHDALLEQHEYLQFGLLLVAQALTITALGRVVVAMFRDRADRFGRDEQVRPGMGIALGVLAAGCLATGVAGPWLLDHVIGPAAAVLSNPGQWATAVLTGTGHLTTSRIPFDYASLGELVATAGCVAVGLLLLRVVPTDLTHVRARLTAIATGSVNDYAAYLAAGAAVMCFALAVLPGL